MIKMRTIKSKLPNRSDLQHFNQGMKQIAATTSTDMLRGFRRTVKTWYFKPKFSSKIGNASWKITIDVGTGSEIYARVNDGTEFIYDRLSANFEPKTRPGVLDSFPGRGGKIGLSATPLPGIIPRKFDEAMVDFIEPLMFSRMDDLIDSLDL
jgi:hypothetical protein